MIKKLLKQFLYRFSYEYKAKLIEEHLSNSECLYDLENRQKLLDKKNAWNHLNI